MRISILALEGMFDTGLTVMLDAFSFANKFSARQMGGTPYFGVSIVGGRKKVRSARGLTIPVQPVTADLKPDWVVVPAVDFNNLCQRFQRLCQRQCGIWGR
jgi:transcriptional regulator GlxA family with amidase domain